MNEIELQYKKYIKINIFISITLFLIALIVSGFKINSISILIITFPLFYNAIFTKCFKGKEHLEYTKIIVTKKEYSKKDLKTLKSAGIKVTNEEKKKNEYTYYDIDNRDVINLIYTTRGNHDNFIRTLKFNLLMNIILTTPYIFMNIMDFPFMYHIGLAIILKLIIIIISIFIYPTLPYDTDIMSRKPKPKDMFIGREEIYLTIIQSILIIFTLTIPYMFLLANGATYELVNTIFLIGFIYSILFLTIVNLSEKMFIINFIKIFTNIKLIIMTICTILISIFFYFIPIFNTKEISVQNYTSTIIFVLLGTILFDITKFARYTTVKGSKKYERKNNKKHK